MDKKKIKINSHVYNIHFTGRNFRIYDGRMRLCENGYINDDNMAQLIPCGGRGKIYRKDQTELFGALHGLMDTDTEKESL